MEHVIGFRFLPFFLTLVVVRQTEVNAEPDDGLMFHYQSPGERRFYLSFLAIFTFNFFCLLVTSISLIKRNWKAEDGKAIPTSSLLHSFLLCHWDHDFLMLRLCLLLARATRIGRCFVVFLAMVSHTTRVYLTGIAVWRNNFISPDIRYRSHVHRDWIAQRVLHSRSFFLSDALNACVVRQRCFPIVISLNKFDTRDHRN